MCAGQCFAPEPLWARALFVLVYYPAVLLPRSLKPDSTSRRETAVNLVANL